MKNILNRIHTRWMRRRLRLAMNDLAWMKREYPRRYQEKRSEVVALSAALAISSAEVRLRVEQRAKREVMA